MNPKAHIHVRMLNLSNNFPGQARVTVYPSQGVEVKVEVAVKAIATATVGVSHAVPVPRGIGNHAVHRSVDAKARQVTWIGAESPGTQRVQWRQSECYYFNNFFVRRMNC